MGDAPMRGVDLEGKFGIDLKLAWKICRIFKAENPFECVRYLPGTAGTRIFCEAAQRSGVPAELIEHLRLAFASAKSIGLAWAGDARAFELLAAGLARSRDPRVDLEHRKNLFVSGSYVWGIRVNTQLRMDVLYPAADGQNICATTIRGFLDVERLRADAPWYVEAPACVDDDASATMAITARSLDGDSPWSGAPYLMRRFCSAAMPQFEATPMERTPRVIELPVGALGAECRFTLVHGAVLQGAMPARQSPGNEFAALLTKVLTPCERIVFDAWVHESILPSGTPLGSMYSVLDGWRGQYSLQFRDRLPIDYEIREMPKGKRGLQLDGYERMPELTQVAFDQSKHDRREFRHFRAEVVYPPVPTTMTIVIKLPK